MLDNAISIVMRTAFIGSLLTFLLAGSAFGLAAPEFPADTDHSGMLPMIADDTDQVPDFDFTDFSGKKRKFSEFKGKVVLIDFWATWCGPCLADIPKLKKLYEKYNSEGFEILAMNAETIGDEDPDPAFAKEAAKRARQIVTTRGAVWTQADAATSLPVAVNTFGVKVLPTKVLIGRDGKVIAVLREKDDTEKAVADAMAQK